ncbi:hypothetical protein K0A96_00025 [Patescibacteria group bacterium]|nr:hypothetical protein [Patescibacteria group bacterium]
MKMNISAKPTINPDFFLCSDELEQSLFEIEQAEKRLARNRAKRQRRAETSLLKKG